MRQKLKRNLAYFSGTFSIDWIVMTATVLGIGLVLAASMQSENGVAANVRPYLSERGFF